MDSIATIAVTCNVALSTFVMEPIKHWPLETKFLFFILAEKGLFSLRSLICAMLKDQPDDVTRIYDQIDESEKVLTIPPLVASPKAHDFSRVNIGLAAYLSETSDDASDADGKPMESGGRSVQSNSARNVYLKVGREG
mmetsp:Transcript_177746/g.564026  ORF Transcript_177746/g.564026 Transcript_177746/m.564026 type:complete len:138 (-) Transcript_177746:74-487(-)